MRSARPLSTFDTVLTETAAWRATSWIVVMGYGAAADFNTAPVEDARARRRIAQLPRIRFSSPNTRLIASSPIALPCCS